jgi:gamma-glutamyltranspeptidase/glutathione hydrolase
LDPASWDPAIFERAAGFHPRPLAAGDFGVSAQSPLTAAAGIEALRAGGSAADAVVAMVAVDCVVQPGTCSLAGTLGALVRSPDGQIEALNAGMNRPLHHGDGYDHLRDRATGEAVLVPGCVPGLETLWTRHGSLEWSALWTPALALAVGGFPAGPIYAANARRRADVLLASSAASCLAPEGRLPAVGNRVCQPSLSATIAGIANGGAEWFQTEWAADAVAAVGEAGGHWSVEDFTAYGARWDDPLRGSYLGTEIVTAPAPHYGGGVLLTALRIAEALRLHELPPRELDGQALAEEISALDWAFVGYRPHNPACAPPETIEHARSALTGGFADKAAAAIRAAILPGPSSAGAHSHQLCAVDASGLMISATHTIQSDSWGDAGLFAGGVALNSSAFQVQAAPVERGARIAEPVCNFVVRVDDRVVLAGAINSGLLGACFQAAIDLVAHRRSVGETLAHPRWGTRQLDLDSLALSPAVSCEALSDVAISGARARGISLAPVAEAGTEGYVDAGYLGAVERNDDGTIIVAADHRDAGITQAG